jgi:beta-N-acetylhexosaminidase
MTPPGQDWGEIFVCGYQGIHPPAEFISLLKAYRLGGVIFFERNIPSPQVLQEQITYLSQSVNYPLFFMIDQEGGRVNRIKKGFPVFPGNKFYGDKQDFKAAKEAYRATSMELRKLGLNVNLAPVADVVRDNSNYMAERSFGSDSESVAQFTKTAVEAIHSAGIFSCAKHFPGIGNLKQDPHEVLPVNRQSAEEFRSKDFIPFQAAIEAGVELVMTTHVKCPSLDATEPATFSGKVIRDILRKELKFEGLIISDDMEMGGMANNFEIASACEKAFLAGHNLLLICHSIEKQGQVLEYFAKKIASGEIPQDRLQDSLDRIKHYKKRLVQNVAV